jgi:hypothetical protein
VPAPATTLFVISHVYNAVDAGSQLITTVLGFAPILTAIALLFRQHILDYFVARVGEHEERPAQILTILLGSALGVFVTLMGRSQRHRGHGLARAAASHGAHRRIGYCSFVAMRDGLSIVHLVGATSQVAEAERDLWYRRKPCNRTRYINL